MANENDNKTTFEECYLASYSEENRETSTLAELCSAKRNSMMLLHNETLNTLSNESTCFILKQNLFEYSQLMNDNLKPDSKNSFTKSIDFLLKGKIQTRHCSSWRCSLRDSKIDTLELLKDELVNSNHCNVNKNQACKNDEVSDKNLKQLFSERNLDDIEDELKKLDLPNTIRHCPKINIKNPHIINTNVNKSATTNVNQVLKNTPTMNRIDNDFPHQYQPNATEITNNQNDNYNKYSFKNQSKSMTDQSNEFFNPGIRKSNSGDMNKYNQMKRNEPAPTENKSNFQFKTARTELMVQNMKKYGNAHQNVPQYQENVSAPKRSLGTTRSVGSKFIPPIMKSNEDFEETKMESETIQDERLKHIDPKMVELIMSEIIDSSAPIGWDDIAGLEFAKTAIQEAVVWPLLRPDIFTGLRRPPRGILLFGPPGTGKTLIGKCIASQCSATFFSISASSLTSKWLGDGEKMVRALFAVARCHQPAVVFIDEIDSLLTQRSDAEHEATRRIKTEFLVQLDGAAIGDEDRLLLIGATNRPQELDEAARRRLVKRLYIPLPDLAARKQIIKRLMTTERHCLTDDEVDEIAALADGFSGADMRSLCAEAALGPIRTLPLSQITNIHSDQVRPIIADDFKNALTRVRPSVSGNDLEHYIKWDKTYGSGNAR